MSRFERFRSVGPGDDTTRRALDRLDVDVSRYRLGVAVLAVAAGTAVLAASVLARLPPTAAVTLPLAVAGCAWVGGEQLPRAVIAARRRRAVGAVPALVNRAVVRMRIDPTAEAAAEFAASGGDGLLASRLAEHVRRARGTPRTGLDGFAEEWTAEAPELSRACSLLGAAATAPADERGAILDRARDAAIDGARERAEDAAARLKGPVTAVYAFGVLLPLALVAALPAARVAGLPVTAAGVVLVYDVVLPLCLCAAAAALLARRPVAAPVVAVPASHPTVGTTGRDALAAAAVAAVAGLVAAGAVVGWARPLGAIAAALGAGAVVRFRGRAAVRERVRDLEAGLPDALDAVGRRVRRGESVEAAVYGAAAAVEDPAGALLADVARRQRSLGIGVEAAFLGPDGALATTPSARAGTVARLFALAGREGRPAGSALVAMGGHFAELRLVERDVRRAVRDATATMGNTAAVFAPLVGGVTVALANRVAGSSFGAAAVPTPMLGAAVGWYVLALAAILTGLAAGLERGFDPAVVGYRVGLAVPAAAAVYLAAYVAGGLVA